MVKKLDLALIFALAWLLLGRVLVVVMRERLLP